MSELATTQNNSIASNLERLACNPDADVNKLEALWSMQNQALDRDAKKAYMRDMSLCQSEMPTVVRDSVNQQTKSLYAKFETVLTTTKPTYTKHGFSLSFGTEVSPLEGHVRITCDVMHREGHSEHKFADLPLDDSGIKGVVNKTAMHATASTYSYGERYLFCMIFNITIADQDNDGVRPGDITVEKLLEYNAAVRELFNSINAVKTALAEGDYSTAFEAWAELSKEEQLALWKAPTKGGIFTTEEIKQFKSSEWSQARQSFMSSETEN